MKLRADQIEVGASNIQIASLEFTDRDFGNAEIIDFVNAPAGKIIIPVVVSMSRNITTPYESQIAFNVAYASGSSISGFVVEANTGISTSVKAPDFSNFPNAGNQIKITKGSGTESAGIGKIKFTMAYYLIDTI